MLFKVLKQSRDKLCCWLNWFIPNESINESKRKWNKLAQENARYYVVSKQGKGINEEEFRQTGLANYQDLIKNDFEIKARLNNFSNKKVLNIGCGIGRLEEFMSPDFGEVYGIDISESMINQAKERLAKLPNVKLFATDGLSYPFDDNFFDLIFSYIVFQHMPSREIVEQNFREIYRTLKTSGITKIQIRSGHQPFKWQWFYGPAWKKDEAVAMVEKIGFRVLRTNGEETKRFWLWLTK